MTNRPWIVLLSIVGWAVFAAVSFLTLLRGTESGTGDVFQVDWHVYWAGARDLVNADLYRIPLDAGGRVLSASEFSLPPLSAAWAVPLLAIPEDLGGYVWQGLGAASLASAGIATLAILHLDRPWLVAGMMLGPLSVTLMYIEGLHLGTNNYLVLGLVAIGCWALMTRRDRAAGVLIGLAIATKLWPGVLLVVALRHRRRRAVAWAAGVTLLQGLLLFGWLGFDALGDAIETFRNAIPPTGILIGPGAVPPIRDAWNGGLGAVTAMALLALPLHGRAGIGVAILAGLAVIPNLWVHYAPTALFAAAMIAADVGRAIEARAARDG